MKAHRIYAILLRYVYNFKHSADRVTDVFYWPTIDLLLWGLTSVYFRALAPEVPSIVVVILSGLLFWIIVWRGQYEVTVNLLTELWDKNLVNIFVSPLKFSEWVTSFLILGFVKALVSFGFATVLALLLYRVGIFEFGLLLIPFVLPQQRQVL